MQTKCLEVIVEVALPCPLHKTFEYLAKGANIQPGMRVSTDFARRKMIGVITAVKDESEYPGEN